MTSVPTETGTRPALDTARSQEFTKVSRGGRASPEHHDVAVETPVAIEVNGIGFAVMMASPADLEDFGAGFALAEGLITSAIDIRSLECAAVEAGHIVRLQLDGAGTERIRDRVRSRVTESACGLCGLESLEAVNRPLPRIATPVPLDHAAVFAAYEAMRAHQPVGTATRATHAAALCTPAGEILLAREDVGRHNALDKLIGATLRRGMSCEGHFALVTSRLSYELVEKAAMAGLGGLAAISAATSLALARAEEVGLPVLTRVREQSYLATRTNG